MRHLVIAVILVAFVAAPAAADWVYGGSWSAGYHASGVAVSPKGNVYTDSPHDNYMMYYTSTGSLLGSWDMEEPFYS